MPIQISSAKVEDIPQIQKIYYETWLSTYPNEKEGIHIADLKERFKKLFSEKSMDERKNLIESLGDDELFLVAKDEDVIVGVCFLEKDEAQNRLSSIYILPNYQKRGIGQLFWKRAESFFDRNLPIVVDVVAYNEHAIKFYEKLGFVDTGKRFLESVPAEITRSIRPMIEMRKN